MSTHKNIDRICILVLVLTLLLTVAFMFGEKLGIQVVADEDAESYTGSTYFTENDLDGAWDDNAYTTYITLDGSEGTIDGNGAYFYNGDLVIANAGWYVVTGTLEDGSIIVDAYDSSKVWIRLNGVTVQCTDDACFRVEQADKVFLTLAEGTENTFSSGAEYSDEALEDNTGGVLFSHDDLTINGSGSLHIIAAYKHGIDVNDSLVITGGQITITAPQDGIHVNDSFRFMAASLTIDAGDDAVHSDGELYVESGQIMIESCYEGLEAITIDIAGGEITIYPTDDGLNANGGSQTMGFGGPMGMKESQTTQEESGSEEETYIRITGGRLTIINENGRDADGLDSNGAIYIDGGEIYVSLQGDGSNCAIDYNSEGGYACVVTGGRIIACGGSSMTEEFSQDSTQCAVLYNLETTVEAGTLFQVTDANGTEILSYTPQCAYSSIAFSAPELTTGATYTVSIGTESIELTPASTAETLGNTGAMGGGMQHGGMDRGNEAFAPQEGTEESQDTMTPQEGATDGEQPTPPEGEMDGERPTPPEGEMDGERPTRPEGEMNGERPTRPEGEMYGEQQTPPEGEMRGGFGTQPEAMNEHEQTDNTETSATNGAFLNEIDGQVWLLLGVSVLVLAGGILIGWRYRKH